MSPTVNCPPATAPGASTGASHGSSGQGSRGSRGSSYGNTAGGSDTDRSLVTEAFWGIIPQMASFRWVIVFFNFTQIYTDISWGWYIRRWIWTLLIIWILGLKGHKLEGNLRNIRIWYAKMWIWDNLNTKKSRLLNCWNTSISHDFTHKASGFEREIKWDSSILTG